MKTNIPKHVYWLLMLPTVASWFLLSIAKPAGLINFETAASIVCCISVIYGYALAIKTFSNLRQRLLGGLVFAGCSLILTISIVFVGCEC